MGVFHRRASRVGAPVTLVDVGPPVLDRGSVDAVHPLPLDYSYDIINYEEWLQRENTGWLCHAGCGLSRHS